MVRELESIINYSLSTLLISCNVLTTFYIYPILSDFVTTYGAKEIPANLRGLYIGATLGLYEIFRIIGSYLWKRVSNYLGISMCVNISLMSLAVLNFLQSYTFTINNLIIIRSLAGLLNNLSTFTKSFILGIFSHNQHKKIMKFITIYQNFSPVVALLTGVVFDLFKIGEIFNYENSSFNKYSPLTFIISFLSILTLILAMVKFRFKVVIPKRRTQFHEQIELHMDLSQRKDSSDHNNQNPYSSNLFEGNKFSSPVNKPTREISNLDIFSSNSKNVNESGFNSHPIPNSTPHANSNMLPPSNFTSNVSSKNSVLETVENEKPSDKSAINDGDNYDKLNEVSNISKGRFSGRKIMSISEFDGGLKNENEDHNDKTRKVTKAKEENHKLEIKIPSEKGTYKSSKFNNPVIDSNLNKNFDTANNNYRSSNLKILTENTSKTLLGLNQSITKVSFTISLIFTILQICDVVVYNILILTLMLGNENNKWKFSIFEISLFLSIFHLIYAFLSTLINSILVKWFIKSAPKLNFLFKLFTALSSFISVIIPLYDYQFLKSKENKNEEMYSSVFILMTLILARNLCLTVVLTCYNLLVFNISNSAVKDKIQTFQKYVSSLFRGVFSILSCFIYNYFLYDYMYNLLLLGAVPIGFLIVNFVLVKSFNKIV